MSFFPNVSSLAEQGTRALTLRPGSASLARLQSRPGRRSDPRDLHAALADPSLRARLEGLGAVLVDSTPEEFKALIAVEIPRMAGVLQRAQITGALSVTSEISIWP